MKKSKTYFITSTAIFIALLVAVQAVTAPLGQLVTGTAVNLILICASVLNGSKSGYIIAVISPLAAKLFGIGPALIQIIPVICAANAVLVFVYSLMGSDKIRLPVIPKKITAVVLSSVLKFGVLYIGINYLVIPMFSVQPQLASKLSAMFGISQIITALSGGIIASIIIPLIHRTTKQEG